MSTWTSTGTSQCLANSRFFCSASKLWPSTGPEIAQAEFLEQRRLDEEVLRLAFPLRVNAVHLHAGREALEERLHVVVQLVVGRARADPVQVARDRADVFRDRPLVVVEDDDQPLRRADDVVERLERDAAGERRVAADRDDVLARAAQIARGRHAERGGKRGAGVAGAEGIVRALAAIEEAARAAGLAQLPEKFAAAAGEQLVHVALMGDVEDKLVLGRVEDAVQRDRQLDHAEIRADVPAVFRR